MLHLITPTQYPHRSDTPFSLFPYSSPTWGQNGGPNPYPIYPIYPPYTPPDPYTLYTTLPQPHRCGIRRGSERGCRFKRMLAFHTQSDRP